jgi:predicted nucleotidyltransferase
MKHFLKKSEKKNIIKKISSFLGNEKQEIAAAYLFGSFIKSEFFADIDLGVITNMDLNSPLKFELGLEARLEDLINYPVDLRILNHAPLSFCQNVIRHGKVIIDKDPNLRAEFTGKVLKQYFDFSIFRKRYLNEVINAPV